MSRRSRVRQVVLQLLYQDDLNPSGVADWRDFLLKRLGHHDDLVALGEKWFLGVRQNRAVIDDRVSKASSHWKVNRMPPIDRNIIRLAVLEFVLLDTPPQVAINEAIELAKRFGSLNSARFVNGVLDRVMRTHLENHDVLLGDQTGEPTMNDRESLDRLNEAKSFAP